MADTNTLVDQLSGLTVLEVADLVKQLEEKWGVSAAAPVAVAARRLAAAVQRRLRLRKRRPPSTSSSRRSGANKIARHQGSPRAVSPASAWPKPRRSSRALRRPFKEGVTKEEAEEIKKKIEAAGAKVEIK